jgi:hypothetical protein
VSKLTRGTLTEGFDGFMGGFRMMAMDTMMMMGCL